MNRKFKILILIFGFAIAGCYLDDGPPLRHDFPNHSDHPPSPTPVPPTVEQPAVQPSGSDEVEESGSEEELDETADGEEETGSTEPEPGPESEEQPSSAERSSRETPPPLQELDPEIVKFEVSTNCGLAGTTVTLRWEVVGAVSIQFTDNQSENLIGMPPGCKGGTCSGSIELALRSPGEYRFTLGATGRPRKNYASMSRTVNIEIQRYNSRFTQIAERPDIKDVAFKPNSKEFYLATDDGLYRYRLENGTVSKVSELHDQLSVDVQTTAVGVNRHGNDDAYFTATKGVLYDYSGNEWSSYGVEHLSNRELEVYAIASYNNHFVIGTDYGVWYAQIGDDQIYPTNLLSKKIDRLFASEDGFFAIAEKDVYYSSDGEDWDKESSGQTGQRPEPKFFQEIDGNLYVITNNRAYKWGSQGWTNFASGVSGGIKAVGQYGGQPVIIAGNRTWLQRGVENWEDLGSASNLPEIKGFYESEGRNFVWNGGGIYEWTTTPAPVCTSRR